MQIRRATKSEAQPCSAIYNHWVHSSTASFDTEARSPSATERWHAEHSAERYPLLVATDDQNVVGWGTLSAWSDRIGYRHTAEISIFVHPAHLRAGAGKALGEALLGHASEQGMRTIVARLTADNLPSRALFERLGFTPVGVMHAVGYKFGRWLDVLIMECDLRPTN